MSGIVQVSVPATESFSDGSSPAVTRAAFVGRVSTAVAPVTVADEVLSAVRV